VGQTGDISHVILHAAVVLVLVEFGVPYISQMCGGVFYRLAILIAMGNFL
jgi:hypothetical protein